MRDLILPATILLTACAAIVYAFLPATYSGAAMLRPDDPATVATGKTVYADECASCHGANGEGQAGWDTPDAHSDPLAPPHDGTGHTWQHPDQALFQLTKFGTSAIICRTLDSGTMPEFGEHLSDEAVVAVLSYIKSRWPAEIRARHDQVNARYAMGTRDTGTVK